MRSVKYFFALVRDAVKSWASPKAPAVVSSLVLSLVVLAIVLTTGRAVAQEHRVLATVDAVGTRLVTLVDGSTAQIHPQTIAALNNLSGVTWAVGLGPATEFRNLALSERGRASFRAIVGDLPPEVEISPGRTLRNAGEALIGPDARRSLGMFDASGGVGDGITELSVVGEITAEPPLDFMNRTGIYYAEHDAEIFIRYIYILVEDASQISELQPAILAAVAADAPEKIEFSYSEGAILLREALAGEMSFGSRQLMLGILTVGMGLVTVTFFGVINARKRDIGRRRALGASRSVIVFTLLSQSAVSVVIGVTAGTVASVLTMGALGEELPEPKFLLGVALLTFHMAILGAFTPAITAAWREPVRILRIP